MLNVWFQKTSIPTPRGIEKLERGREVEGCASKTKNFKGKYEPKLREGQTENTSIGEVWIFPGYSMNSYEKHQQCFENLQLSQI